MCESVVAAARDKPGVSPGVPIAGTFPAMPAALQIVLTVAVGFVGGVLSGMFGIGGAVVTTPAIRALGATTFQAIGSTLPSILPSSISGLAALQPRAPHPGPDRAHHLGVRGARVGARFAASPVPSPATATGSWSRPPALVGFTAYRTAFPAVRADGSTGPLAVLRDEWWMLALIGIAAGALSGLLGIGGGILMVPAFSTWVGLPLKDTIATSLACVGIFAIPGTITHAFQGDIDWTFAIALAAGVIPGAQVGAQFTIAADDKTLRYSVGAALGIIAVIYAAGEIYALGLSSDSRRGEHRVEHVGREPTGERVLLARMKRAEHRDRDRTAPRAVSEPRPAGGQRRRRARRCARSADHAAS